MDQEEARIRRLIGSGRYAEALDAAGRIADGERALRLSGAAAICGGNQQVAQTCLSQIERLSADRAVSILRDWAGCCADARQFSRARTLLHSARSAAPDDPDTALDYARYSLMLGDTAAADAALSDLVRTRPDDPTVHEQSARLAFQIGDGERALEHALRAIELAPDSLVALRTLGDLHTRAIDDDLLADLAAREPDVPDDDVARVHRGFALGSLYEVRGEPELAFLHYAAANRAQALRAERNDLGRSERALRGAAAALRPALEQVEPLVAPERAPAPIFVVGVSRSGTTLVEQILAAHPSVAAAGERGDLPEFAIRLAESLPAPGRLRRELRRFGEHYRASGPDPSRRAVDKQPMNFRLIELIVLAFPDARIIRMHRDPHDVCVSNFASPIRPELTFATSLDGICGEIDAFLTACERSGDAGGRALDVGYERLVRDPAAEIARILRFCQLEWNDACLRFHDHRRPVHTISAVQVRQPLNDRAVGRWRPFRPNLEATLPKLERLAERSRSIQDRCAGH